MNLRVLAAGPLTTVQDLGRNGWRHVGVARGGGLDPHAVAVANCLVGNAEAAAVLEITVHGPSLQLLQPTRLAICGAQVAARFEDESGESSPVPGGRRVDLPPGTLRLGAIRGGLRGWMAFAGGIDVPVVLGSRSTDLGGGFGGHEGRALRRGDRLSLLGQSRPRPGGTATTTPWWVDAGDHDPDAPVRFVASGHPAAARFAAAQWHVDPHSNRQGLRLQGNGIPVAGTDLLSAAVAPGTLQLPPDGQPIVLLADAQTVGGYPRLGYVIAADLPRLAQARPGTALRFQAVAASAAQALTRKHRAALARLRYAIADRLL